MPNIGIGIGNTLGGGNVPLSQYYKTLLGVSQDRGMYFQRLSDNGFMTITPIDDVNNCIVRSFKPYVPPSQKISIHQVGYTRGYYIAPPISKTGVWTDGTYSYAYTTTVGAVVSLSFTGTEIYLYSYTTNAGGIWSFSIDGGDAIVISVYRDTAGYLLQSITTGLTYGSHTIVGTFMGNDPLHAPNGGTSKGFMCLSTATSGTNLKYKAFYIIDKNNINFSTESSYLSVGGPQEFAIGIRKFGEVFATKWIPEHDAVVQTTFSVRQVLVDGVSVNLTAGNTDYSYAQRCNKVKIIQTYTGVNSNQPAENLVSVEEKYIIVFNGVRSDVKITALQDLYVGASYLPCLSFNQVFDNLITSQKNEYATTGTGTTTITEGTDFYYGCATNKGGSGDLLKILSVIKLAKGVNADPYNKNDGNTKLIWINRTAGGNKLYTQVANAEKLTSGSVYRFSADYVHNKINDAYGTVKAKFGIV